MRRRISSVALLLLLMLLATGCGLLGIKDKSGTSDAAAKVEATVQVLAAAVETQDSATIKRYLAEQVVAQLASPGVVTLSSASPQDAQELVRQIEAAWEALTIEQVVLNIASIDVDGDTAHVEGSFVLIFAANDGTRSECVGTGSLTLVNTLANWVVTRASLSEISCSLPGSDSDEPGDTPPGQTEPGDGDEPGSPAAPHAYFDRCYYLVRGSQGEQVHFLQTVLRHLGYYKGLIDGDFGPVTETAVKAFQKDHKLYVDGEVGPKTIAVLNDLLAKDGGYYQCGVTDTKPIAGETFVTVQYLRAGTAFATPVYIYDSPNPGRTLVFVGCIHGNERSGHLALREAIDRGITISRGRLVLVPEFNKIACEQNRRTMNRSSSLLHNKDFNRLFPVGSNPSYLIAKEMWELVKSQPNLAFVVDFHDGFNNSLANSLIHTRQSEAGRVARKLRDELNKMRPSNSKGPKWRAMTEPISGSLARKVGRDLNKPAMIIELAGRTNPDPLSLRKQYVWTIVKMLGREYGMEIMF